MGREQTLFVFVTFLGFAFLVGGDSSRSFVMSRENILDPAKQTNLKSEGIVKTIKIEHNSVISCVNVYKQPAFQHPLLVNHTIQWMPTTIPMTLSGRAPTRQTKFSNSISENDLCPENTIPIRLPIQPSTRNTTLRRYQFAILKLIRYPNDMFYGGSAFINVNSPECEPGQNSGASIWLGSDLSDQKNFIKAGWMVDPEIYGDSRPRLSIYWTGDGFHKTGCYDLLYPGFIQINSGIGLGLPPFLVTKHGGSQTYDLYVKIFQDATTKDWWLIVGNDIESTVMGYWPKELFPRLGGGGTVLRFGGSVMTQGQKFPPMGDGQMPEAEGDLIHSTYFRQIHYVNGSNYFVPPRILGAKTYSDNSRCYRLLYLEKDKRMQGSSLYVGGPGGQC